MPGLTLLTTNSYSTTSAEGEPDSSKGTTASVVSSCSFWGAVSSSYIGFSKDRCSETSHIGVYSMLTPYHGRSKRDLLSASLPEGAPAILVPSSPTSPPEASSVLSSLVKEEFAVRIMSSLI